VAGRHRDGADETEAILRILASILLLAAAVAVVPGGAAAHHGKKEEHAQPASTRKGCSWVGGGASFTSMADCMKGGRARDACRRICQ
jgi:hypothetical protein